MQGIDQIVASRKKTKRLRLVIAAIVVLAVIVAIVVPVGIILSKKKAPALVFGSTVIVPLYIYPDANAWDPLFKAIEQHSSLKFLVVVNPDSGPGNTSLPNADFMPQIKKLNGYSSVETLGYVRTGYQSRNISDVLIDVQTYVGWGKSDSGLTMNGIFFDEVTNAFTPDNAKYLSTINSAVKQSTGFQSNNFIVHNPGMIQDNGLENNQTDVTVVFEGPFSDYTAQTSNLTTLSLDRTRRSYIINSVPGDTTSKQLADDVDTASQTAQYLFFTYLAADYYSSFDSHWTDFIASITST